MSLAQGIADLANVKIEGTVDTNKADTYRVIYTYTDNSSNEVGMAILTVVVQ